MTDQPPQGQQGQQPQQQGGQGGGRKPGSMTMAMQAVQQQKPAGPKVLRVGVIQGGKIVEERIIRKRETVSVGTSEKNHFIVQAEGLPSRFDLFQLVGEEYVLNFTDQMRGRVGLPGGVQELEQLRQQGGARNAGTHWQVKLTDSSKGKIVIGDVTLLFQFVSPPPVMPRPQLPAAARGGFVKGIDWVFTAFIVFSYMLFFGTVIYLENADWPIQRGLKSIPKAQARLIFEEPPPPEPDKPQKMEKAKAKKAKKKAEKAVKKAKAKPSKKPSKKPQKVSAEERARIRKEAKRQAKSMILGALGKSGSFSDVLRQGAVTGNAEEILAQTEGTGVAEGGSSGELRSRSGGGGSGHGGGLGGLEKAGGKGARQARKTGKVKERRIRGNADLGSGFATGGAGTLDQSVVQRTIKRRMAAFKRCYETELKNNPSLSGKVTVQFTIVQRGTVQSPQITTNTTGSSALGSCVKRTITRMRFRPGPKGGSVTFSYPFVFARQG